MKYGEVRQMSKISDLRQKEVINVADGKRLGFVCDVEFDLNEGKILAVIVPGSAKITGLFSKNHDYVIPWRSIKKIGDDIIIVEQSNPEF